jgi:transposase
MINNKYSKEFKLDAVSLVSEQGYTQADAARSLGICPKLISR